MGATNSRASPEPERTVVPLPEENPETEQLAGALDRQGATSGRPTWGANQPTVTDDGPHHHGYADDIDACVVSSTGDAHLDDTYADDAQQPWPNGANEGAHSTRTGRHQLLAEVHPDDAHQSTPDGAYECAHHTRASRRQLQLVAHPNGVHLCDSHHGSRTHEPVNAARRRESDNDVGAHSNATGCEPSPTDGGHGCT